MPTTPILALPYPSGSDPADVPTDMNELATRIETVRGSSNGLASLDATGKVPAAQLPAAASTVIPLVTTLPASPTDGQEAILVDSLTNPSYQWRFRWNAGSSSAHKWEFVGGSPGAVGPAGLVNISAANTWTDVAGGPTFVVPRAGIYQIELGLFIQAIAFTGAIDARFAVGTGSGTGQGTAYAGATLTIQFMGVRANGFEQARTLNAGDTLRGQGSISAAQQTQFKEAYLRVVPAKVS